MQVREDDMSLEELEFFNGNIRKVWHSQEEEWYISIVDVCQVLAESENPQVYWRVLKKRLVSEGNETVTNCNGLKKIKLLAADGKMRLTDCTNPEGILRIVQSIPSKKAEPFKQWLAKVGAERLAEMADPEKALGRGMVRENCAGLQTAQRTTQRKSS